MKTQLLLFYLIILSTSITAIGNRDSTNIKKTAKYYEFIKRAESDYNFNLYRKAISNYDSAFTIKFPYYLDYIHAAECSTLSGNNQLAFNYINNAVLQGYEIELISSNFILSELKKDKSWISFEKIYNDSRVTFFNNVDIELLIELNRMQAKDFVLRKYSNDSTIRTIIGNIYDENLTKLMNIIRKQGFPTPQKIGYYAEFINTILLHSCSEIKKRKDKYEIDSLLLESVFVGSYKASAYASWKDMALFRENQKQVYGSITIVDDNGIRHYIEFDNIQNVDSLRKTLFLGSLKEDSILMYSQLPKDYKSD